MMKFLKFKAVLSVMSLLTRNLWRIILLGVLVLVGGYLLFMAALGTGPLDVAVDVWTRLQSAGLWLGRTFETWINNLIENA